MHSHIQSTYEPIPASGTHPGIDTMERRWFAIYTAPRHEKQVSMQLQRRAIECFLPICETVRRWKTGPTRVSLPLFPSYVFAHVDRSERRKVVEVASVLNIVGNRLGPSALADHDIEQLRKVVSSGLAEPHPYLNVGSQVRIIHGPLAGTEGVLVRKKGHMKIVVSIELIMQSVAVEVNSYDLETCGTRRATRVA